MSMKKLSCYTVGPLHQDLLFRDVQYIATRPWIPIFPHAKNVIFVYFTYLEQKKKNGIQWSSVLVFRAYLGATSLIWCGFRQTINPIKAIQ